MNRSAAFLVTMVLALTCAAVQPTVRFRKVVEKIEVISESEGYRKKVTCYGAFLGSANKTIEFSSNELEKYSDFHNRRGIKKNGEDNFRVVEETITGNNFYDGVKVYTLRCTDTARVFELEYKVDCSQLLLLSSLPLISVPTTDTLIYEISCPRGYRVVFKTDDSLGHFRIDTVTTRRTIVYTVTSTPKKIFGYRRNRASYFEAPRYTPPLLRLIVNSASRKDEWSYFNDWFLELVRPNSKLDNKSIEYFNGDIVNISSEDSIVRYCFEYVRENIRYLAIENGLEAFMPRNVNDVLRNRYGDCKDMANLICQMLRHYGVRADIALIGTLGFPNKMDFPSLASANHAICTATTGTGRIYYLDATDKVNTFGIPSSFTQGQPFFVASTEGGFRGQVPVMPAARNRTWCNFDLKANGGVITGSLSISSHNYEASLFKSVFERGPIKQRMVTYSAGSNPGNRYSDIEMEDSDSSFRINAKVNITDCLLGIENKKFLLFDFLAFPHHFPEKIREGFRFIPFEAGERTFNYIIEFNEEVTLLSFLEGFHEDAPSCSFDFDLRKVATRFLEVKYTYRIKKPELSDADVKDFERINDRIRKIFSTPVRYELASTK